MSWWGRLGRDAISLAPKTGPENSTFPAATGDQIAPASCEQTSRRSSIAGLSVHYRWFVQRPLHLKPFEGANGLGEVGRGQGSGGFRLSTCKKRTYFLFLSMAWQQPIVYTLLACIGTGAEGYASSTGTEAWPPLNGQD